MTTESSNLDGIGEDVSSPEWERTIRSAVESANVPTLLMVLVQLTGELRWIDEPFRVSRTKGMADNDSGGLDAETQKEIRDAAAEAIVNWKRGVAPALPDPEPDLVAQMLAWSMGERPDLEYGDFLKAELAVGQQATLGDHGEQSAAGQRAIVIGGGVSGIAACARLRQLGVEVLALEKSSDIGGVWNDNRYPGAGVDTPSHLYSYSFYPGDWSQYFATRGEISNYLHEVVEAFDLADFIQLESEVLKAEFDEESLVWNVHFVTGSGEVQTETADFVVSCVGAFNPPVVPSINGLSSFQGPNFHSAEWPADLNLEGRSVALVGNGATAMQIAPAIAGTVGRLTIFQRSPQWVQPFEKFQEKVPEPVRLLFREVPLYRAWYRLRLQWIFHDKLYQSLQRDPNWSERDDAINETNAGHRDYFTRYISEQLGSRTDLIAKVVPNYPPFGKRMLLDNGWFRTLAEPNVELVTEAIDTVGPGSVRTADGHEYDVDAIVFATGFDVVRFISSFDVVGRGGRNLRDVWDDVDCRAYLGLAVPGFPNFFTIYGPNTQTGHGGSLIHTVEAQLDYLASLVAKMSAAHVGTVDCRPEVYDRYAADVDEMHRNMVWTHPAMSTYYRNALGRVVVINPFRNLDYWRMTREANLGDYIALEPKDIELSTTNDEELSPMIEELT